MGEVSLQGWRLLCDVARCLLSAGGEKRDGFLNCLAVTIQRVLLFAPQQVGMSIRYEELAI